MHQDNNVIYFIHGAYQSPALWNSIIEDISLIKNGPKCVPLPIPGYYIQPSDDSISSIIDDALSRINNHSNNTTNITIVGHSLGSFFTCLLLEKIENKKITLFFSSIPLYTPNIVVQSRLLIEKFVYNIAKNLSTKYIPLILRPKILTDYCRNNILTKILTTNLSEKISENGNKISHVYIACGKFDILSGGIKRQRKLTAKIQSLGVKSSFYDLGFTGHYPHVLNKDGYTKWLLTGLKHV